MLNTYFIGDIHGCFNELQRLLDKINYDPDSDELCFAGDLVNKGPASLKTMLFIMQQPHAYSVLGNHDLHLLALSKHAFPEHKNHNMHDILESEHCENIIQWLRNCPFVLRRGNNIICHAGIHPNWSIAEAVSHSEELQKALQQDTWIQLLENMYGNLPNKWRQDLTSWDRIRCLLNIFTRMRFITADYSMNFKETGASTNNKELAPWFESKLNLAADEKIFFGHWASLRAEVSTKHCIAIDGGCVWGHKLVAVRLSDGNRTYVNMIP